MERGLHMVNYAWIKRIPPTALTRIYIEAAGAKDEMDLMEGLSNGRYRLQTRLAIQVVAAARAGDAAAQDVIRWAGEELGWLAISAARQIEMASEEVEVIQSGSVFEAGEIITKPMRDLVLKHCPKAKLIRLDGPPVIGAVILGIEQINFDGYAIRDTMVRTVTEIIR
jgi:N-acetylglucosamine kinase-like BadF-type ATPase